MVVSTALTCVSKAGSHIGHVCLYELRPRPPHLKPLPCVDCLALSGLYLNGLEDLLPLILAVPVRLLQEFRIGVGTTATSGTLLHCVVVCLTGMVLEST